MSNEWRLRAAEFGVAWDSLGRDRLPYPLAYRPVGLEDSQVEAARRAAAQRLGSIATEELFDTLQVLCEPQIRVEIHGFSGAGLRTVTRIHAGIRRTTAAFAVQLPGPDIDTGADVVLSRFSARMLASKIAVCIPQAQPGSRTLNVHRADLQPTPDTSVLQDMTARNPSEDVRNFFERERTSLGEITVFAGSSLDSRAANGSRGFHWIDFLGDGRYIVRNGRSLISAEPASTVTLAESTQQMIAATARAVGV